MLLFHVPFFWAFQYFTGIPMFWGAMAGCTLYFVGYEYTHYLMHVPKGHYVERFRWFLFLREHHRLHHKYMLRNLNVFIPLADLCFGTLVTSEGWRSKPQKRRRFLARLRGGEDEQAA
jgi:sterol desaturase/sphingolipid hydroxylase (fatty acid hydroxylase superfamily)